VSANGTKAPVGFLLREWRQRRRLSQLDLASTAEVSSRHLSFVETGKSKPSREMVLHLAEQLDVPLRERNGLLLAAGYAPIYHETDLSAPPMVAVRTAVDQILAGHEPYPAVVVDRRWNLAAANDATSLFIELLDPELLEPPVNVMRASLHPKGMAPRIVNLAEHRAHLLVRLRREMLLTNDLGLAELYDELVSYPQPDPGSAPLATDRSPEIVVPLRLRHDDGELAFFSSIATFGTPADITVEELSIESFFPADDHTAAVLRRRAEA
jgi:transcriptional regulator with XRE-family HTH domain